MNRTLLRYSLWIIILPLLQALIFNHVYLFGFINPLVYVLFVIIFPFKKNKIILLLLSFLIGLSVDLLSNEGGIHAFALVFVAYFRLIILTIIKGELIFDDEVDSYKSLSAGTYYLWAFVLIVLHHLVVFTLEKFSWVLFGQVLVKTIITALLTYFIVIFIISVFLKKKNYE